LDDNLSTQSTESVNSSVQVSIANISPPQLFAQGFHDMVQAVKRSAGHTGREEGLSQHSALEDRLTSELRGSAYHSVRSVACRLRNGVLTLDGQVSSYFHKQMAQTVVLRQLDRSIAVVNQLRAVGQTT